LSTPLGLILHQEITSPYLVVVVLLLGARRRI
jgi:hypothetical protein